MKMSIAANLLMVELFCVTGWLDATVELTVEKTKK